MLHRELDRLFELVVVERDGLLAEHVLAGGECLAQVLDMRVVRRRDVDDVDVRILEHVFDLVVNLACTAMIPLHSFLTKQHCRFSRFTCRIAGMRAKSKMLHRFAFVPAIRYNKENKNKLKRTPMIPVERMNRHDKG